MRELSRAEIDSLLEAVGYGFLGLASEGDPYVIPMSFGYDGGDLYFQMNSRGEKFEYMNGATPACFAALSIDQETAVSRSVMVSGTLREAAEDETDRAYEALADNASFGTDLTLWGVPLEDADPTLFVLRSETLSGRAFGDF